MIIFSNGIKVTGMSVLNLTWNLISNVVITIIGIYYFNENESLYRATAIIFGPTNTPYEFCPLEYKF